MRLSQNHSAKVIVVAGLLVGAGVVAAAAAYAAPTEATAEMAPLPSTQRYVFPQNASGLTFGSELDAVTLADAPDLILAYATNGNLGYIKKADRYPTSPNNPQAALAEQAAGASKSQTITVYRQDGVTPIGVFVIAAPTELD